MHNDGSTLRKASIVREASRIVSEEGVRAFWKGNLVTIAHRLPYSSISFYAYERYKKVSTDHLTAKLIKKQENCCARMVFFSVFRHLMLLLYV